MPHPPAYSISDDDTISESEKSPQSLYATAYFTKDKLVIEMQRKELGHAPDIPDPQAYLLREDVRMLSFMSCVVLFYARS